MARTPLSPAQAQKNAAAQALDAKDAAVLIGDIVAGIDRFPQTPEGAIRRADALADAARVLEAAGCYVRRQHAKGLLIT